MKATRIRSLVGERLVDRKQFSSLVAGLARVDLAKSQEEVRKATKGSISWQVGVA